MNSSSVLTQVQQAGEEYDGLLDRMEDVTTELMTAIAAWDVEKVGGLIEDRSKLCEQIGLSIQSLDLLQSGAENDSGAESPIWKLEAAMRRMRERQQSMLKQQQEAEQALAAEIHRRRSTAAKWNQAWGGQTAPGAHSRFLDSKT